MLDISNGNKRYVFVFFGLLLPFFKRYFGESLKPIEFIENTDVIINYRLALTGRVEKLQKSRSNKIFLYVPLWKIIRATIRSLYQVFIPKSSSIGLFEYFVYLIRMSFLEPVEEDLARNGFFMIHGAVLTKNDEDALVLVAASRGGKSTVAKVFEDQGYRVVSDNYAFFNGVNVITVSECRRYGDAKRFSFSFYGKGVFDAPLHGFFKVEKLYWLSFSSEFCVKALTSKHFIEKLTKLYLDENEGVFVNEDNVVRCNFASLEGRLTGISFFDFKMIKDINKTKLFLKGIIDD